MKSIKLIGLSLLAVFALGAFAAMSASAEEGFLKAGGGGPGTGNVLGGKSVLESVGKANITCKLLDESKIEFLPTEPDRHAEGTLHWLGCKAEGLFALNSLGDKAEEILVPILLLVCLDPLNEKKELVDEFGILALVEGTAHLEIPAVGTLIEVTGAALGAVLTKGKAKLFVVEFLGSKGKQTVTDCKNGANLVVHNLLSSTNHAAFEAASENIEAGLVQFSSEVELMDS